MTTSLPPLSASLIIISTLSISSFIQWNSDVWLGVVLLFSVNIPLSLQWFRLSCSSIVFCIEVNNFLVQLEIFVGVHSDLFRNNVLKSLLLILNGLKWK